MKRATRSLDDPTATASALRGRELEAARWRAVLAAARDAIIGFDAQGKITVFNAAAAAIFGYRAEEVLGRNVSILMPLADGSERDAHAGSAATAAASSAHGRLTEVAGRRQDGTTLPLELSVSEACVGREVIYTAIARDVSEKHRMRNALRVRAVQQAATAELGATAIRTALPDLMDEAVALVARTLGVDHVRVLELTPGGDRLLLRAGVGWKEGLIGRAAVDLGPDSQAGYVLRSREPVVVRDLRTEKRFRGTRMLRDHGIVSGVSVMIHAPHGPYGILSVHSQTPRDFSPEDVSFVQAIANVLGAAVERAHVEEEGERHRQLALQRQRLADVGALTTKIVHDIGNPLAGVSMLVAQLRRRIERDPEQPIAGSRKSVEQLTATVRHLDALVTDFKGFAREQRLRLEDVRLPSLLEEVASFWEAEATVRGIALVVDAGDPPPIRADREKLRRVLDNLIKNALEAIEHGPGTVGIASRVLAADKIGIVVTDTGPGFPVDIDAFRLFETTKPNGTGLGLAIVRQIIDAHGGGIDFARLQPHGTAFHIELPREGPGGPMLRDLDSTRRS